ncbi:hypothetical protein KJY77_05945 [Canibacter sp. lx-72]|uniref:hypothetical protein n=1 Tax=Canibacter zhuwentaonis TaxID=2837491 RepID=UPI001BDC4718|nr:hypothetical protein [Canibacter zhuwentaonis]MBT1018670.1 hypothetical protein [Canibacter zhuwentaonis]
MLLITAVVLLAISVRRDVRLENIDGIAITLILLVPAIFNTLAPLTVKLVMHTWLAPLRGNWWIWF